MKDHLSFYKRTGDVTSEHTCCSITGFSCLGTWTLLQSVESRSEHRCRNWKSDYAILLEQLFSVLWSSIFVSSWLCRLDIIFAVYPFVLFVSITCSITSIAFWLPHDLAFIIKIVPSCFWYLSAAPKCYFLGDFIILIAIKEPRPISSSLAFRPGLQSIVTSEILSDTVAL